MNRAREASGYALRGAQWLKDLKDGDHPAFTYRSQLELAEVIASFVDRGLNQNEINVFFITWKNAERYIGYLKESGIEADTLLASKDIIIEPIDDLLEQDRVGAITESVRERLQAISGLARKNGKRGLNIVGEIAGTFAARGRYEDCVLVEIFWHALVPSHKLPITLIRPYESIPAVLTGPLEERAPFCFDCISAHPILKPSWLRV